MSRFLKSQEHFMKCLGFVLLLGFISFGAIVGCNNNGGGGSSQDTQALTENDFSKDPGLSADPTGGVVIIFLEHQDSEKPDNDTGEVGIDRIPHRYTSTLNHTFCWEDDDGDAEHFMELVDSEGNEILKIDVNGECVTAVIEPGDYVMTIHHDGKIEKTHPIFIIPGRSGEQAAQRIDTNEGLLKSEKNIYARLINNLHNIITREANAQTVADNVATLLNTNSCSGCDLQDADLSDADVDLSDAELSEANLSGANLSEVSLCDANLNEADLSGANLNEADLVGTGLFEADLSGAILSNADMQFANLNEANLSGANLSGAFLERASLREANLSDANLSDADLEGADLTEANLSEANLKGALNLSEATLSEANLSFATWTDGSTCDILSSGMCNIISGNPTPCDSLTASGDIIKCVLPTTESSIDLVNVAHQVLSIGIDLTQDTPMWIQAWGATGGNGSTQTGDGGVSGSKGFTQAYRHAYKRVFFKNSATAVFKHFCK